VLRQSAWVNLYHIEDLRGPSAVDEHRLEIDVAALGDSSPARILRATLAWPGRRTAADMEEYTVDGAGPMLSG
jgi:hypothetical protein